MKPSRRVLLAAGAGAVFSPTVRAAQPLQLQPLVETYAAFGDHRAGSDADAQTRDWLTGLLRDAGADVRSDAFDVNTFQIGDCTLATGDTSIAIFPQWPASAAAVDAPIKFYRPPGVDNALAGTIAVARLPFMRSGSVTMRLLEATVDAIAASGAVAALFVTEGPTGEAIVFNAPDKRETWPIPVALCGARDLPFLMKHAESGRKTALRMQAKPVRARTANLIATFDRPGPATIVTTPMTGWFRCGGERGPGIAALIAIARWAATRPERFVFGLTSAHELGDIGAVRFAQRSAPRPEETRLWVRLGAGFAARSWAEARGVLRPLPSGDDQRFIIADTATSAAAKIAFAGQPGLEAPIGFDPSQPNVKEAQELLRHGYQRYLLTFGFHLLHHTALDDARTTDEGLLQRAATGVIEMLLNTP